MAGIAYHAKEAKDVLKEVKSSAQGLDGVDAKERLLKYGLNELKEGKKISPFKLFLKQFDSVVVYILIAAVLLSMGIGYYHQYEGKVAVGEWPEEYIDALVIAIIIVLIGVLGFIQEFRAEKAIEALKRLASQKATVLRNGQKHEIDAKELVVGDILLLESGNKVPADCRLIDLKNLKVQEAALTGESNPVSKELKAVKESAVLAERHCMVYCGTTVVNGKGTAVVIATAMATELGKIAAMIESAKPEPTPLQVKMDELGRKIGLATIVIGVIIFVAGALVHEHTYLDLIIVAISVAVAAIPEGLPAVVTVALAIGTQKMLRRHALVRRLPSVETLGSTTVICTDKTGTLTKNEMTVKRVFVNGKVIDVTGSGYDAHGEFLHKGRRAEDDELHLLLTVGALNNDADVRDGKVIGDPTEGALVVAAQKAGIVKREIDREMPRIDEVEFTSERKMMTTVHNVHGEYIAYVKGAPEMVLSLCSTIAIEGRVRQLTAQDKEQILAYNREFANDALRVLGFAYRTIIPSDKGAARIERNLTFVGMQGMMDPARDEVREAIAKCHEAGIRVVMITGDQETTAKAVAKEIGLIGKSMTGAQLDEVKSLEKVVDDIVIFSRVNPEHKLKIVDALKKRGHIVAMTGDGVNDAPALKRADIGVAMGITGTDVAKEASSIVLVDDNFASIVNAVEEGRGTYDNIRKYFGFLISGNIAEVLIIFLGIVFGFPLPVTATQILLINLVTDGLPALALSADPFEPNAMKRKPRARDEPIHKGMDAFIIYYPLTMTIVALGVFWYYYFHLGKLVEAQTATFLTIVFFELYQAFSCRSTIYPVWQVGAFKNKWLVGAVVISLSIAFSGVLFPSFGHFIDMVPLSWPEVFTLLAISSLGSIVIEISKVVKLRRAKAT